MGIWAKLSVFCVVLFSSTDRSVVRDEIIRINKAYFEERVMGMDINVVARDLTKLKVLSDRTITIYKMPGYYYSKQGQTEIIVNDKFRIDVHNGKKLVLVKRITTQQKDETLNALKQLEGKNAAMQLDTVLDLYQSVDLEKLDEKLNRLLFVFKQGRMQKAEVMYSSTGYKVQQLDFYMKGEKEQSIKYTMFYTYKPAGFVTKALFSEQKFFTDQKGKLRPKGTYVNYEIKELN